MSRQIDGIDYEELNGSGEISIDGEGLGGTRLFKVAWDDCMDFASALKRSQWINMGGLLQFLDNVHKWTLPDGTLVGCSSVRINGLGPPSGDPNPAYDFAIITATYSPRTFGFDVDSDDDEDIIGDLSLDYSCEFISSPRSTYMEKDTSTIIQEPVGILLAVSELTLNMSDLTNVPYAGIRNCRGTLNDRNFRGASKGRVLFLGASTRRVRTALGLGSVDLLLRFKERSMNWNYALGKDGSWHEVVDAATGTKNPYEYTNFNGLMVV